LSVFSYIPLFQLVGSGD